MITKPPLWHQQKLLPKRHAVAVDAAAHELAACLSELPDGASRFDAQEVETLAERVITIYLRTLQGN